ncbi:MAG: ATP-binding protein [Planctomyces sp.]|jgi:serine/threonine-protein kinase RsbW|nr:ATP-binding protein [Planctomyces sp.]
MPIYEQFEINIPSDTAEGQAVQERIIAAMETAEFSPRDVFGMRLALEEGLVNAIKHGNRMDPEKTVRVACEVSDVLARVEIEDQGPGFDWNDVPDPTAEENLERPCGRGIMLMRAFMSKVEYNESGNKVLLEKLRVAPEEPA